MTKDEDDGEKNLDDMSETDMAIKIFKLAAELPYEELCRALRFIEELKTQSSTPEPDDSDEA